MNMRKICVLSVVLSLAPFFCLKSNAAIVLFQGQINSGSGTALGNAPPDIPFSITLDFTPIAPGFANINSGSFSTNSAVIDVVGGLISLTENGANDTASLALDTVGPIGSISTNFFADAVSTNEVSTANLIAMANSAGSSDLFANFGGGGNYSGTVTSAVPEPSSVSVLLSTLAVVCVRRRKRA